MDVFSFLLGLVTGIGAWPLVFIVAGLVLFLCEEFGELRTMGILPVVLFFLAIWMAPNIGWMHGLTGVQWLAIAVAYPLVGAVYAWCKWWRHLVKVSKHLQGMKNNVHWSSQFDDETKMKPGNVSMIINWIALWPLSLLFTFIGDFIFSIFEETFEVFKGFFVKLTVRMKARLATQIGATVPKTADTDQ